MLYWLIQSNLDHLEQSPFGFLRVLTFPEFQALLATLAAFLAVLLLGGRTIEWLRRKKIGDNPNADTAAFSAGGKAGTPTMGGLLIVAAIATVAILFADIRSFYVQMGLICLLWLGAVGAADDWLKLTVARRQGGRQGLTSREKLLFQVGLAVLIGIFAYRHGAA